MVSRRTLLARSSAALVAAPFLSRGRARASAVPAPRLLVLFTPDGTIHEHWRPRSSAGGLEIPGGTILEPLSGHRDALLVVDNMDFLWGDNHEGGMADMLTAGGDTSLDQHVAASRGGAHRFSSLTLGVQTSAWGGSTQTRMSYRDGAHVTPDDDPLSVWARLFGGVDGDPAQRHRRSVLDLLMADLQGVRAGLGAGDRARLSDHLDGLRTVERALFGEASCAEVPDVDSLDAQANDNFPLACLAQIDLAVAALACGSTPVASVQMSHTVSPTTMTWLGHTSGHHTLSHSGDSDPVGVERFVESERWFAEQVAYALDQLASRADPERGGTLLDHTVVLWCKELGDGRAHTCEGVPWVIAGGGTRAGLLDARGATHDRVLTALCQHLGLPDVTFGTGWEGALEGVA